MVRGYPQPNTPASPSASPSQSAPQPLSQNPKISAPGTLTTQNANQAQGSNVDIVPSFPDYSSPSQGFNLADETEEVNERAEAAEGVEESAKTIKNSPQIPQTIIIKNQTNPSQNQINLPKKLDFLNQDSEQS